jgi:hypothetical protein
VAPWTENRCPLSFMRDYQVPVRKLVGPGVLGLLEPRNRSVDKLFEMYLAANGEDN